MKDDHDRGTRSPDRSIERSIAGSTSPATEVAVASDSPDAHTRGKPRPANDRRRRGSGDRRGARRGVRVRSASTETDVVRHASAGRAPPTELALDKMTEAMLWAWSDGERREFMRQDIQRVMRCSPVEWLHREIDMRTPEALESFKDDQSRFVERFIPADGFLIGEAKRSRNPLGVERLAIAWRCATG